MFNPFKWLKSKIQLVLDRIEYLLKKYKVDIDEANRVVNEIKRIVDSPVITAIVKITPTNVDDKALVIVNNILEDVIEILRISKVCENKVMYREKLVCFIEELRKLSPEVQKGVYLRIASQYLYRKLSKIEKPTTCDTLVQVGFYQQTYVQNQQV